MNVFLDSIGCRLNQSEIEIMAAQFRRVGHSIVSNSAEADLVIVNTCAVTNAAASDSRQKIRQAAKIGNQRIIVTGCWATLDPFAAKEMPGVENVILNEDKANLVSELLHISPQIFDVEPLAREPLPGEHQRTRAFIKVQDGCNNFCTFCITKIARGREVSLPLFQVLNEIHHAIQGGTQEVVLSGVHLGSWGKDLPGKLNLEVLLRTILNDTDIKRIRLSSLEPWDLSEKFFEIWSDKRLCNHLHLPLQSGSDAVLRRMARKTTKESFRAIIKLARGVDPDMAITTDMIVGFPGETDQDFSETVDFIREINFSGGHTFSFSSRPGTPAARYDLQVPGSIRKKRSAILRALFIEQTHKYQTMFIGNDLQVLWESSKELESGSFLISGLTGNYLKVSSIVNENRWNIIETVHTTDFLQDTIFGTVIS